MISGPSSVGIINQVAESLVAKQRYPSMEKAIFDLALSSIQSKIIYYRRRIRKLEKKYGTDFNKFSVLLKNQANPSEEDDWLAWRSALSMLAEWKKTYQDLLHESAR